MELFLNCKFIKLSIRLIYSGITSILLKEAFKFFKFGKFNKINDISDMLFLTIFNDYIELIGSLNIYILEIELNEISKTRRFFNFSRSLGIYLILFPLIYNYFNEVQYESPLMFLISFCSIYYKKILNEAKLQLGNTFGNKLTLSYKLL